MRFNILPDINNSFNERVDKGKYIIAKEEVNNTKELFESLKEYSSLSNDKYNTLMMSFSQTSDDHFIKDNFIGVSGIVLDIDDGITIEEFKESFDMEYILYTTHSHTSELNKFRVVIPFNKTYNADEYELMIIGLKHELDIPWDESTFARCRCFVLPPKDSEIYLNESSKININYFIKKGIHNKPKEKVVYKKISVKNANCKNFPSVKKYLKTSYNQESGNGDSNYSLYVAICCCVKNEDDETLGLVLDKALSEKWTESELNNKITKAKEWV